MLAGAFAVPASPTRWTDQDPKGLAYKDEDGVSDGVTKIQLKTGATGKSKASFSANGDNLVLSGPAGAEYYDQDSRVVVQLVSSQGECWTGELLAAYTSANDETSFKAKTR